MNLVHQSLKVHSHQYNGEKYINNVVNLAYIFQNPYFDLKLKDICFDWDEKFEWNVMHLWISFKAKESFSLHLDSSSSFSGQFISMEHAKELKC